jgi:hypothetical protein
MFKNFPKKRPKLPEEIKEIYSKHYKSNREGETTASSLSQKMESWLHRQVARDLIQTKNIKKSTLELGAGTLNQLLYETNNSPYDIVEPFGDLFQNSPLLERVRNIYSDISEIPGSFSYDRITSVATLEHICNLPEVIAKSALFLKKSGVFRASIPNEGTWLWTLGWKLTTGLEFKLKYGLDYGLLMKHEHVNTAEEIETILKYFFSEVEHKVFGLSKSIALYRYYECKNPKISNCQKYLETINS